jgi:hypothetical protein
MADMSRLPVPRRGRPRSTSRVNGQFTNSDEAVVRLQLDAAAKQALDNLCDRKGMTLTAAMSRLTLWLVNQDEIVQAWVLNLVSRENLGAVSETVLKGTDAKASDGHNGR